jgi:hypothetical protein
MECNDRVVVPPCGNALTPARPVRRAVKYIPKRKLVLNSCENGFCRGRPVCLPLILRANTWVRPYEILPPHIISQEFSKC